MSIQQMVTFLENFMPATPLDEIQNEQIDIKSK